MSYSLTHSAGIIYPNIINAIMPSATDLLSFTQAMLACIVFMLLGKLITRRHAIAEISLFVGSAAAIILLFVGEQFGFALNHMRIAIFLLAALGGIVAYHDGALQKRAISESILWRVFIAATPLWLCLISLGLWQSDTLNSWIPNYQYLARNNAFPVMGDANAAMVNSLLCFPLLGYVGSVFAASPQILMHLNVLFSLALLVFILRIATLQPKIKWRYVALNVPLFFMLNYHYPIIFSSYADMLMSLLLGVIIYVHATMEKAVLSIGQRLVLFFVLVLLTAEIILIKASGVSLVALWFASMALVYGITWLGKRTAQSFKKIILPALLLLVSFCVWAGLQGWLNEIEARNQVPEWVTELAVEPDAPIAASATITKSAAQPPVTVAAPVAPSMPNPSLSKYWQITIDTLHGIVSSPVMALVFLTIIALACVSLKRRDTTIDSILLYACALSIVGYIVLRILIYALVMDGYVTSEQRYAYHVLFAGVVTLALTLPNMLRKGHLPARTMRFIDGLTWKHVIGFYVLFMVVSAPFIRSDVRERKLFMHQLAREIAEDIETDAKAENAEPFHLRLYYANEARHANHYAVLLRGLIAVNRPDAIIDVVYSDDIIPANADMKKEYGSTNGYIVEFCVYKNQKYQANLLYNHHSEQRLLKTYPLPRFNDSKVQICE